MQLSRRSFARGVLGAGLAGLAGLGPATAETPDLPRTLAAELNSRLLANPTAALFSVTGVETAVDPATAQVLMTARLRLDWTPGMRQRLLRASGATDAAAWAALRDMAVAEFAGVVPGFAADRKPA